MRSAPPNPGKVFMCTVNLRDVVRGDGCRPNKQREAVHQVQKLQFPTADTPPPESKQWKIVPNKDSAYQQQLQQKHNSAAFCPNWAAPARAHTRACTHTARSAIIIMHSSRKGPELVSGACITRPRGRGSGWSPRTSPLVTLGPYL